MEWSQDKIYQTIGEITARSVNDPALRKLALDDPRAAIQQVAGLPLPEGVSVRFVENQGMSYTIGLPKAASADGELNDEELASVAGGTMKFPGLPPGVAPMPGHSAPAPAPSTGHATYGSFPPGAFPGSPKRF